MIRAILAAMLVAACSTVPRAQVERTPSQSEDAEDAVQRMKDEFNDQVPNG